MITKITNARIMSFADRGVLKAGNRADLVLFDEDIVIQRTIVGGQTVYTQKEE